MDNTMFNSSGEQSFNISSSKRNETGIKNIKLDIVSGPKLPPRIDDEKFCWKCHCPRIDLYCASCPRSFHRRCVTRQENFEFPQGWTCGQCKELQRANNSSQREKLDLVKLNNALIVLANRLQHEILSCVDDEENWKNLKEKLHCCHYKSTVEFICDIKWIEHNFLTKKGNQNNVNTQNHAKQLIQKCRAEMRNLELCSECYQKSDTEGFTDICNPPHQLVWAKWDRGLYWPAKYMNKSEKDKESITVQFFNSYKIANVKRGKFLGYSKVNPNKQLSTVHQMEMNVCILEVEKYIENYERVHGPFAYSTPNEDETKSANTSPCRANASSSNEYTNVELTDPFMLHLESIRIEYEKQKASVEEKTTDLKRSEDEQDHLKTELANVNDENSKLKLELEDSKAKLKQIKNERDALKKKIDTFKKYFAEISVISTQMFKED